MVGEYCLQELLQHPAYKEVHVLARKSLGVNHPKLRESVVDFNRPESYAGLVKADDVFCTIGTTIAKAGSQEAFKKIDYELPLHVARAALKAGAQQFILCSATGADASSGLFYNRVKGELEEALEKEGFTSLLIFRPSILLGNRKEKRPGEAVGMWVAKKLDFLFAGPLARYKGTPADLLAQKMVAYAQQHIKGVRIVENEEIVSSIVK